MSLANGLLMSLVLFCFHPEIENNLAQSQTDFHISGKVEYSDGSAAGGARVIAESTCTNNQLVQETTTKPDGRFSMKAFDPNCNKYKLSASYREAFWLSTGNDIFYLVPNGTTPTIELMPGKPSAPVLIRLEQRGGEVELRVFDEKSQSFVYAGLSIDREPVGNKTFGGGISIATGVDGSLHSLFLPAGKYVAKVERYMCHDKTYFSASPATFKFNVRAGMRQTLTVKVNTAKIQARSSYDNIRAARCSQ